MTSLEIKLKRIDKIYHENENIIGIIIINTTNNSDLKHDGITLTLEGTVNLQLSSKSVGILEAFYNSVKPIQLINITCDVSNGPGRIPSSHGQIEIPFEIPLKSRSTNRILYETYHGVYVNISYSIRCDVKRSFLSKDLQKSQQFLVQYLPKFQAIKSDRNPVKFRLTPVNLVSGSGSAPDFTLIGQLNSTYCNITKPFTGFVLLEKCAVQVKSIELQLVRVETCGCAEGYAREATEIQNIQIGDGDIPHNIKIPIFMIFPRLFTCPTLITKNFKIEFEVNLVILFQDDHLVTNNFPIILVRE